MSAGAPVERHFELGLLGFPVAHSASPAMHHAALGAAGLRGRYGLWPAETLSALEVYLARLRTGELHGANVTIPWKVAVADRCDVLVGCARDIRAVNTLVRTPEGLLEGHNTDAPGLAASVLESFPNKDFNGVAVAVIGTGGAARSALLAAALLGAGDVRVFGRRRDRAEEVVRELGRGRAVGSLETALSGAALVLQASAWGFNLSAAETRDAASELADVLGKMADDGVVYDLVYKPSPTAWTLASAGARRAAVDGLGMLAHQAALAFKLWTGVEPDVADMFAAARRHVAGAGVVTDGASGV